MSRQNITRENREEIPKITLNRTELEYVDTVKNLDIIFNQNLSWNDHIYSSVGKTYGMKNTVFHTI